MSAPPGRSMFATLLAAAAFAVVAPLPAAEPPKIGTPTDPTGQFIAAILGDTEDRWKDIFARSGQAYRPPRLVLYRGTTAQPCGGTAVTAMGAFYCADDQKIYLDPAYLRELETRLGACAGTDCQASAAFVIARAVGQHVQNLLGTLGDVKQRQQGLAADEARGLQTRIELQADCLAGVWLHHAARASRGIAQRDIDAAGQTAAAMGDERMSAHGGAVPDSVTRGSSEQRLRWFARGVENGTVAGCDTFGAAP